MPQASADKVVFCSEEESWHLGWGTRENFKDCMSGLGDELHKGMIPKLWVSWVEHILEGHCQFPPPACPERAAVESNGIRLWSGEGGWAPLD